MAPITLEKVTKVYLVLEDASRGSGLIWEFGRTLVKQAVRN